MKSMSQTGWNRALARILGSLGVVLCLVAGAPVPSTVEALPFRFPISWLNWEDSEAIADNIIPISKIYATNTPADGQVLTWNADESQGTWADGGTGSGTVAIVGAYVGTGIAVVDSTEAHPMLRLTEIPASSLADECFTADKIDNSGTYGADGTDYVLCKDATGKLYWRLISDINGGGE